MSSRVLAIGDIHGCDVALRTLVDALDLRVDDTLVFLGDAIDRGPGTKSVVEQILALESVCDVIWLTGNHEEMMRYAISGRGLVGEWLQAGGQATVDSYGGSLENVPPEHIRFLVSGRSFWETDHEIFVHASLEPAVSLKNQTSDYLRWKHVAGTEKPSVSGKRVICGHTAQRDGVPLVFDGWVCIDTYAHGNKWLSCLNVGSDHVTQASQDGQLRDFPLSAYA